MDIIKRNVSKNEYLIIKNKVLYIKKYFKLNYKYLQKSFKSYDYLENKLNGFNNEEIYIYLKSIKQTLINEHNNYLYYMKLFVCAY